MKIKAVLFDLDETVLDRSKTLENYLAWESNEHLSLPPEDSEKYTCLLYTSPSPRDATLSRMPSSA